MEYLDTNVFLYAILYQDEKAQAALEILESVFTGYRPAATCTLTVDEIIWVLMKRIGRAKALQAAHHVHSAPNLRFLPATHETIGQALRLMQTYRKINPRDAIHAAAALAGGATTIVSDDAHFDAVGDLKRRPID